MKTSLQRFFLPVVFVGVLALAGVAVAEEPGGVLTLEEAVNFALKQNPSVTEFKERMNAAMEQVGVTRSALLPQATFAGTVFYGNAFSSRAGGEAAVAVPGGTSGAISVPIPEREITTFEVYRFSFTQLFYDFGKTPNQVAGSKANFKKTGEDYANTRQQVVLTTRTAYFSYLAARRAIKELEGDAETDLEVYCDASSEKYAAMIDRIRQRLALTTLKYQELGDLVKAIGLPKDKLCTYCWDGCEGCSKATSSAEEAAQAEA